MMKNTYWGQHLKLGKNIRKVVATFVIAASLSACTTVEHKPLSDEVSTHLVGKKVALTQYTTPDFIPMTAGTAAFAMLGVAVMIAQGHAIVEENELEDPALKISQELAEKLKKERGITLISNQNIRTNDDDVQKLVSTYPGADYLLDVKTFGWALFYYPTDWMHYKILYNARLRLIDASTQKVTAEALCKSTQGDEKNPPTKDQLLDNKASLLKAYLAQAASGCVNLFSKDILKLPVDQNAVSAGITLSGSQTASPILIGPSAAPLPATQTVPSDIATGAIGKWNGLMTCDARKDSDPIRPAYQAKFAMDVSGTSVSVHRETAQVVETLSGRVVNSMLYLQGTGHRIDSPSKVWEFKINGEFPANATAFSGNGGMFVGGKAIRACELTMIRG